MSKFTRAAIAATLAAVCTAGLAATESRTLNVTAVVPGACVMSTTPMAFGILNMLGTGAEVKDATVTIKCAPSVTASNFRVGGAGGATAGNYTFSGTMLGQSPSPEQIAYTIGWNWAGDYAGEGFTATGRTVTLTGTIPNANYISKKPDTYFQAVVLTVDF